MGTPTYPSLWNDILAQFNAIMNIDFVKGALVLFAAIGIARVAIPALAKALQGR